MMRRARRATNEDRKAKRKDKHAADKRIRATDTKSPSSSPFHFCDTHMELVLMVLPFTWSGHRDHDSDMEGCVCRRLSEDQPIVEVFPGDRPCKVALNVLWLRANRRRRRRIRIHK